MNNNSIVKFGETKNNHFEKCMRIDFKKREPIQGFIIAASDYDYLSSKNLWRIVLQINLEKWRETRNLDLAKIFNGEEITKLSLAD